ncbi:MAG: Rid family detoxifying hydrolase [Candidatus Aquicultor sp.]|nr:Rid family detoxifying hydrolase [Candidatus Aquicultor sp.]
MNKITIITEGAPLPVGPYSQGIRAENLVFVSGQIPLDPNTGELVDGDMRVQTQRALMNVESILLAGNSSFDMTLKMTVYLSDIADFSTVNDVFGEIFSQQPPAREAVQVTALPKGARIEISAIGLATTQ